MVTNYDIRNDPSVRAFHRAPRRGENMPSIITSGLDAVVKAATDLQAFDQSASDGHLPPPFVASERARLVNVVRHADTDALYAAQKYADTQHDDIQSARASVEAKRDPSARMADEMERARIVSGPSSGDDLARVAADLLRAGQPQRAALMLTCARDKGARYTFDLDSAVADALDESDPDRKRARDAETKLASDVSEFGALRLRTLAISVGVASDGSAGSGHVEDRTRANVSAKTADYLAKTQRGEKYVDTAEGMNFDEPRHVVEHFGGEA
jgi:hypothetical protein